MYRVTIENWEEHVSDEKGMPNAVGYLTAMEDMIREIRELCLDESCTGMTRLNDFISEREALVNFGWQYVNEHCSKTERADPVLGV